ncbi:unnamed protein product [Pleuronectes platessa]|uniref:Uncharacterized protein n=1 Tax=Pleuronectes platessa TaxID=8262 RepID=A0A9N7VVY1_PLEPL|nr:unnamed protein product [Pleuronectes platessa]
MSCLALLWGNTMGGLMGGIHAEGEGLSQSAVRDSEELISFFIHSWQQHFPAVSGAFMDSPYNGNTSLQTSTSKPQRRLLSTLRSRG